MRDDSTNIQPPLFGPGFPVYPHLEQLLRVSASALSGTIPAIYPGFIQQLDAPNLFLRDRENAYITEPNGIALGPGIYDCRLVGSYLGLPLFATTCCPTGSFSSSSAH